MDRELMRNGSQYVDMTAYKALQSYQKEIERKMDFKRGEIFEYEMRDRYETKKALVVSADFRASDRYISIIILTDEPKGKVTVPIMTSSGEMYADCGMISFSTNDRLSGFLRCATDAEMAQVDEGIAKCLGIEQGTLEKEVVKEVIKEVVVPASGNTEEIAALKTEAKVYKDLYESLLEKVMG